MGKRIEREKMTIQRMIASTERRCPGALADNAHYQGAEPPTPTSALISACLARINQPASSVRCIATSRRSAKR